jgi:hypothetical protein
MWCIARLADAERAIDHPVGDEAGLQVEADDQADLIVARSLSRKWRSSKNGCIFIVSSLIEPVFNSS